MFFVGLCESYLLVLDYRYSLFAENVRVADLVSSNHHAKKPFFSAQYEYVAVVFELVAYLV